MTEDVGRASRRRAWALGAAGVILAVLTFAPVFTCGTCGGSRYLRWSGQDYPCATCGTSGRVSLLREFFDRFR